MQRKKINDSLDIASLIGRYLRGKLSEGETQQLENWLAANENNRRLLRKLRSSEILEDDLRKLGQIDTEEGWQRVQNKILSGQAAKEKQMNLIPFWIRVAAAVLILAIGGWLVVFKTTWKNDTKSVFASQPIINDVLPGNQKAILTLGNGKNIDLNAATDSSFKEEGSQVKNTAKGWLVYKKIQVPANEVSYNTIRTPKGGEYAVVLDDGTKVWLNAGSSLRYPVRFTGQDRRVTLTGEAYFKVAKNPAKPFIVMVNGMNVQALGTAFNINAYDDESTIQTTLLEGSVKVSPPSSIIGGSMLLSPGQQAQLSKKNQLTLAKDIDTEEITAWKEGYFHFESADLKAILRQFARWYDVEVIYEGEVKNRKFFGIIKRNSTLSNVVKMLQANDIKFRIEGRKLMVQSG